MLFFERSSSKRKEILPPLHLEPSRHRRRRRRIPPESTSVFRNFDGSSTDRPVLGCVLLTECGWKIFTQNPPTPIGGGGEAVGPEDPVSAVSTFYIRELSWAHRWWAAESHQQKQKAFLRFSHLASCSHHPSVPPWSVGGVNRGKIKLFHL